MPGAAMWCLDASSSCHSPQQADDVGWHLRGHEDHGQGERVHSKLCDWNGRYAHFSLHPGVASLNEALLLDQWHWDDPFWQS